MNGIDFGEAIAFAAKSWDSRLMPSDFPLPEMTRIAVVSDKAGEALSRFEQAGFEPESVEQSDAVVTYVFARVPDDRMLALFTAIPLAWWANRGVVMRSAPFEELTQPSSS